MAQRPPVSRLLVSDTTAQRVETMRIQIAARTGREWTKTAIHDALIEVGLNNLDDVMAHLTGQRDTPSDE